MNKLSLKTRSPLFYYLCKAGARCIWALEDLLGCGKFPISFWRKKELIRKFHIWNYNIESFRALYDFTTLKGKSVLELGGSNLPPEMLFQDFAAKQWVSVDFFDWWNGIDPTQNNSKIPDLKIVPLAETRPEHFQEKHLICNGSASEIPEVFGERFDVAVSICAMEHMLDLPLILKNIWKSLKPDGFFYASFAPIWSGPAGSHFWISEAFNFANSPENGVPLYCHLLETPESFREKMADRFDEATLDRLTEEIFHSDKINHLFLKDYIQLMEASPFREFQIWSCAKKIPAETANALRERFPEQKDGFEFSGLTILARK